MNQNKRAYYEALYYTYILTTITPNTVRPYRYDDARAAPKGALIYNSEPTLPV